MMQRNSLKRAVILWVGIICTTACSVNKQLSLCEIDLLNNNKPTQADISKWFQSDLKYVKNDIETIFAKYNLIVENILIDFRNGKPIKIKQPSASPTYSSITEVDYFVPHLLDYGLKWDHIVESKYVQIDQEFGIPILQVADAISLAEAMEISATNRVLQWYSRLGVLPTNSNKRKP